jgi:hypothetical protein
MATNSVSCFRGHGDQVSRRVLVDDSYDADGALRCSVRVNATGEDIVGRSPPGYQNAIKIVISNAAIEQIAGQPGCANPIGRYWVAIWFAMVSFSGVFNVHKSAPARTGPASVQESQSFATFAACGQERCHVSSLSRRPQCIA